MTIQIDVKNIQGKAVKKLSLPAEIYGVELKDHVLHLAVKGYQANRRQGTHATKNRSLVSGGGKKPFKQKGTGNARQGSTRSPLNPGGGTLFGPQPRDYSQKINKKARQLALKMALSEKVRGGKLVIVDDFAIAKYNTKHVVNALSVLGVKTALVSDSRKDDIMYKSTRNIHGAMYLAPAEFNAENVLRYDSLVISETAIAALNQRFE